MNIIIFEDNLVSNLEPFSLNHASFEVKSGIYSNLDRFKLSFEEYNICLVVRDQIKEIVLEKYSDFVVNPKTLPIGFCINGRVVWNEKYNKILDKNVSNHNLVFYNDTENLTLNDFCNLEHFRKKENIYNLNIIDYLWDAIDNIPKQISKDINYLNSDVKYNFPSTSHFINKDKIIIDKNSIIKPGSVLDAEKGPIVIKSNVVVDIGSKIQGPVFIDENTYISPGANIRSGTLIGPSCKIGGEVSNSIFHANSNKVHDGFLGHSYIGEWVNIGAGTNNSNLKNNYSTVRFNFKNNEIDTDRLFLGVLIGDYTRIGISTMLNTGTYIGVGANVFGAGFQKKYIESFAWGDSESVDFHKFINTCILMKERRNKKLSENEKNILEQIYKSL
tara:strand:- start:424 stop:1587 length:1164 start_codon:yes stop_codon:yes gene_type:complete